MLPIIKDHIAKRVIQALGTVQSNESLKSAVRKILLVGGIRDKESIDIHLPLTSEVLKKDDFNSIILPDSVIKVITDNSTIKEDPCLTFTVGKDLFMNDLFTCGFTEENRKCDPKNLIIEFSSPNIAKPFHMGHLRSTIVGNFVANIKQLSDNVTRLNYLGDWGTQVGFVRVGLDRLKLNTLEIGGDPIRKLYEAYVVANRDEGALVEAKKAFTALENGDAEGLSQWAKIRSLTISHLESTYEKLGIKFDEYAFESSYASYSMPPVLDILKREGLLVEDGSGAMGINVEGTMKPIIKNDGSSLYLGRDIAAAIDRKKKHRCDMILYVVDKSQAEHLSCLRYVMNRIMDENIVMHVPFGRVIGMSTRKGTSVFLDDLLEKAIDIMASQQAKSPNTRSTSPDTTRILAVSALMVNMLQYRRTRDFHFDWNHVLRSTGDTGVKLQYTHSRLFSLETNCGTGLPSEINPKYITEPIAVQLAVEMARFEEVLALAQNQLESSVLVSYLFRLCNLVSQCLKVLPIKGQPTDLGQQRLVLFHRSRIIINRTMKVLGLQPLQSM